MSPPTRILVVRHGESTWNAEGRWQGQADPPLSLRGEQQAREAAGALDAVGAVVASDLRRAHHTAAIIAETLGHSDVVLDQRLRERHAGEWQGLTRAEVEAGWPGFLDQGHRPAGFEGSASAGKRAIAALTDIGARGQQDVLVVSHGGILRALRSVLGARTELPFANLGGQWFAVHDDHIELGEMVSLTSAERPAPISPL